MSEKCKIGRLVLILRGQKEESAGKRNQKNQRKEEGKQKKRQKAILKW